jgi:ribosomal protein S18 acetylase RimI-like enzyme
MLYAEDSSDDRHLHRTFHDEIVNGIPARDLKSDQTIWRQGENRIIVVDDFSPKPQRVRAARVGTAANREMHYDFGVYNEFERPDEREIHLFLFISSSRFVGLSILEKHSAICHYTWEEYDKYVQKELEEKKPMWSLSFIWVHKKHRRRGIARILLAEATRYLGVRIGDVGVYTPFSDDGEAFVRSVFSAGFIVAK